MLAELLLNRLGSGIDTVCFEGKRCLRNRLNTNKCNICVSLCKSGALSIDECGIILNDEHCTGCLLCVAACPNDAFIFEFDYSSFLLKVLKKEAVVLSCKKESHHSGHIRIPCIGALSKPLLASMNFLAENTISIDVSACSECHNSHTISSFKENENTLLGEIDGRCEFKIKSITEKYSDPIKGKNTERRSFLKAIKDSAVQCGSESVRPFQASQNDTVNCKNKGSLNISKMLQLALDKLPEQKHNEREILYSYCMTISANDQCDCCPSCAGMCPTGALKRKRDIEGKYLLFLSSACSGCGLCLDFCKKEALIIQKGCISNPNVASVISSKH